MEHKIEKKGDEIVRATLCGGEAVVYLARTTELCETARATHHASALAAAALGRTLTMTAIMTLSSLKNDTDRLSLTIDGKGPIGRIVCAGRVPALVKGYVDEPTIDLPRNAKEKLDVGGAVGRDGTITVVRDLGLREPYVGRSRLVSGEIAEDFAMYFTISEQSPSLVALGVHVSAEYYVARRRAAFSCSRFPDVQRGDAGKTGAVRGETFSDQHADGGLRDARRNSGDALSRHGCPAFWRGRRRNSRATVRANASSVR